MRDSLILILLFIIAGLATYLGAQLLSPVLLDWETIDVWFDGDIPRVYGNMTERWSNHWRTRVHPLFSLSTCPLVYGLNRVAGIDPLTGVRMIMSLAASFWISGLYLLLRVIGCRRPDAVLFSVLGAISAASMFWSAVPTSYPFGSMSILLALILVALAEQRPPSSLWFLIVSALTLSFTITNWMAGIFATFASHPWRHALQVTANAFCLVILLWGVQKLVFPSADLFLLRINDLWFGEDKFLLHPQAGWPWHVIRSFVFHSMVMPTFSVLEQEDRPHWPLMSVQPSSLGSGGPWSLVAIAAWTGLLLLGIWALWSMQTHHRLRLVLGLTLLGQLGLHLLYGYETFLYSLHFVPLLVVLAALSSLTPARWLAMVLTVILIATAGMNNQLQFFKAVRFVQIHEIQTQGFRKDRYRCDPVIPGCKIPVASATSD